MQIAFDCADPGALAQFWLQALPGYRIQPPPPGFDSWEAFLEAQSVPKEEWNSRSAIVGDGPRLFFQRVPEPKTAKNRLHLDLRPPNGSSQSAELQRLLGLGATRVDIGQGDVPWQVLADPEGNEFCLLRSTPDQVAAILAGS